MRAGDGRRRTRRLDCPKCLLFFVADFRLKSKGAGAPRQAPFRFAHRRELLRYHRSLSPFARKSSTTIREAVEFTRLAAKRWRYYSRSGEAAENFVQLRRKIPRNPKSEIAFIIVA